MDRLYLAIQTYQDRLKFPWYSSWAGYTEIRFNKYTKDKVMAKHCDHIHNIFDGKRKGIPTVSIVGSLTGDSEGGYVRFWGNKDYYVGKGECMYFPSNFLYPHKVTEVTKGLRYSFVSWVW